MTESEALDDLRRAIQAAMRDTALPGIVLDAQTRLRNRPDVQMTWASIPLTVYAGLPRDVKSAWVFVLRGGISTGAERHPNSRQRVVSHTGMGDLQTFEVGEWRSNLLTSEDPQRALSIPRNVWHRPVIPPGGDWTVLSFHTVAHDELIVERPPDDEQPDLGAPRSLLYAGRAHR
jgi:hypothetical protein